MFPVLVHCSCICRFILPKLLSTVEKIRVCLKMLDLSPPYCHLVGGLEHEFYFSPCHSDWRVLVIHLDRKLVSIQDILVYRLSIISHIRPYLCLVGGLEHFLFVPYIGNNHPNSRTPSFFRGVAQPPTSH